VALSGKTFRIFISSTFSDLKEERNALQERVFPRLRDLCMAHGFRFQAIDLRWGVSEEASLDQQTVRICLEEIARCQKTALKPNFIVLLGDRYGWCPLPYEIPASEFEEIERRVNDSSTHELLATWYRRDDNAVPPVYCLQRRTGEFVDLSVWEERVERPLRAALLEAVAGMDLSEDDRLKYDSSATEQEIVRGAMKVEDAREHIFCFFRSFLVERADRSVAAQRENGHLSPVDEVSRDGDFHHFVDRAPHGEFDPGAYARLANLKGRLESLLPGKTMKYQARWTDSGVTLSHLDALCTDVYDSLSLEIMKQISRSGKTDPEELEDQAHEEFGEERARIFVGRAAILDTIRKYIRSENRHPLAIYGEPGSGKSALMARSVHEARLNHPEAIIIARFIGATPASTDGRSLLEDLCRRIGRVYGSEDEIPLEYKDLVREFPKRLGLATKEKPLILFLDALDQLSDADRARSLAWFPAELPENANLVASAIPGECMDAMKRKLPSDRRVELGPMPMGEGAELLDRWLSANRRILRNDRKREVLGKFAKCGMPLYLKLAFEEARFWKSYDDLPLGTDGKRGLSEDVPGLIEDILRRLSREEEHGETLVSRSLGYIAAGKNGLTEDELLDVLSDDGEVIEDFQRRSPKSPPVLALPVTIWSRLRSDLERYLTERQADGTSLISFFHRQFEEAITRNYLTGDLKRARHESLARYFTSRPLWLETDGKKIPNLRKLSELPFQQALSGMATALNVTLTDYDFIYAKVFAVGPQFLIEDYDLALNTGLIISAVISETAGRTLELIRSTLLLGAHLLRRDPNLLAGQLTGRLISFDIPEIRGILRQVRKMRDVPWLRPILPSLYLPLGPLLLTLAEHTGEVYAVSVTADGRRAVSGSEDKTVKVWDLESGEVLRTLIGHTGEVYSVALTPDGCRALSGSEDMTLKVWDLESGEALRTLEGHSGFVNAVAVTPDGRRAVSGSGDHTLKVWNLESGEVLRTLEGHTEGINAIAVTPDGCRVVSGSRDNSLKLWDLESGAMLQTLEGNTRIVSAVGVTPDGCRVISASLLDNALNVWDLERGELLRTMEGHIWPVNAIAVSPDGLRVVTGSGDTFLRIWDLQSGTLLHTLDGHTKWINAVAVTSDGHRVVSGSRDKTLKVWEPESREALHTSEGHSEAINTIAVTPDGRIAVSGSDDNTLKVWNLESGEVLHTLEGHTDRVRAVAVTPDGRRAVSGSSDHSLMVWDLENGKALSIMRGHTWSVYAVAVTPDGRRAVSGSSCDMAPALLGPRTNVLKVWDLEKGELERDLMGHAWRAKAVAVTPDGRYAVSASGDSLKTPIGDNTLRVWDLESGEVLRTLMGHTGEVYSVALTPDGHRAVSGSRDTTLKVWDLESGEVLHTLERHIWHISLIQPIAVTPDGRRSVSVSCDKTMKVLDLETGEVLNTLEGHTDEVNAVAVTPDGRRAVSGSEDHTVRVWDLENGEVLASFCGEGAIRACSIVGDGSTIIAGEDSGKVHILRVENITCDAPVVTVYASTANGVPAFGCPGCHMWARIHESFLGSEVHCPNCGKTIRFNLFTINADWRPIEKAWRGEK
jgi:WD40 repeat protein